MDLGPPTIYVQPKRREREKELTPQGHETSTKIFWVARSKSPVQTRRVGSVITASPVY